ncbi:filamin-C-like isoform X1 [Branchiostoma floridae]|uniref:Filamin-C-like isoform X1 n=1 Tax=Branchiostoma floridae TaxID=7739 RepID=A0A9J7MLQ2_BRAFL|nr:filamin-C-like isoform X1 [Branchiostoma floridae]
MSNYQSWLYKTFLPPKDASRPGEVSQTSERHVYSSSSESYVKETGSMKMRGSYNVQSSSFSSGGFGAFSQGFSDDFPSLSKGFGQPFGSEGFSKMSKIMSSAGGSLFLTPSSNSTVTLVRAEGACLKQAYVGELSTFSVDCSRAGKSALVVGMMGPTTPCEELDVKHIGDNKYVVSFKACEKGPHSLAVLWGDEHIPGSPFDVTVF